MIENGFVVRIEYCTNAIEQTTNDQADKTCCGEAVIDRLNKENDHPSHGKVEIERNSRESLPPQQFIYDAQNDNRPHNGKKNPFRVSRKTEQNERGVSSGNQKVDGNVIEKTQKCLFSNLFLKMIYRRDAVHLNHAAGKHQQTNSLSKRVDRDRKC